MKKVIKKILIVIKNSLKRITNKKKVRDYVIKPESQKDFLKSQKGQVRFLLERVFNYKSNGLKRDGYFVDLAAGNPIHLSNTFFIEEYLNWEGLLIEGNPLFAKRLRAERKNKVLEEVVYSESDVEIQFRIDNGETGGIVGSDFDNNEEFRYEQLKNAEIITLKTKTLTQILIENNAPTEMDYLSLDIEGGEYEALKNFDFKKYKWKFITAERPNLKLNLLLDKNGYIQVFHREYDTFYIHKDFIGFTDLENIKPQFLITPRKNW